MSLKKKDIENIGNTVINIINRIKNPDNLVL